VDYWNIPSHMHHTLNMFMAYFIFDGKWNIPEYFVQMDATLHRLIVSLTLLLTPIPDSLHWTNSTDGNCQKNGL